MNYPLLILCAVGTVGAVDVLYYHLYRFRLFTQAGSVGEEITHLCRHVIFLALLVLLSTGGASETADAAILALFAIDMVNSITDVLLERGSRQRLGGLPSGEYLVHVLSSFGIGVGLASYVFLRHSAPLPAPVGLMAWQVYGMLVVGSVIFTVEAALFGSALARRRATTRERSGAVSCASPRRQRVPV